MKLVKSPSSYVPSSASPIVPDITTVLLPTSVTIALSKEIVLTFDTSGEPSFSLTVIEPAPPPVEAIVTCPLDSEVMVTFEPATRYDFPLDRRVKEPENPSDESTEPVTLKLSPMIRGEPPNKDPDITTSPPKTVEPVTDVPLLPIVPLTKKKTSAPTSVGASGVAGED